MVTIQVGGFQKARMIKPCQNTVCSEPSERERGVEALRLPRCLGVPQNHRQKARKQVADRCILDSKARGGRPQGRGAELGAGHQEGGRGPPAPKSSGGVRLPKKKKKVLVDHFTLVLFFIWNII